MAITRTRIYPTLMAAALMALPLASHPAAAQPVTAKPDMAGPDRASSDAPPKASTDAGTDAKPDTPADTAEAELSPEELAELGAALGEDMAALAESQPAAAGPGRVSSPVQSMNPDIALILDVAAGYFSERPTLQTGAHDPRETGFTLQQVELAMGKAVDPYFRLDANFVFSEVGVEVEEAYATTLALPGRLQARVGQFLTRLGRINSTHPHSWDFVDQPFAIGRLFGAEGNRGIGAELSYLAPLPWYVEIIGSITDAGGEEAARSFFGPATLPMESPLDVQASLAIKQFFDLSHDWSLLVGLSAATGPNSTGHANRSDIYGGDLYLKYRPISRAGDTWLALQAEWFYRRRQVPHDLLTDVSGYAYVTWRFSRRWGTALRYELGTPATTMAGLASGDYLDPEWSESRHRASASLTFWPTEFSRIRAQSGVDIPMWREDPIHSLLVAFELTIGAHGAHAF